MTTLYRPVLIESAEQAEALPRGTVATYGEGNMTLTAHRITSIAAKPDAWNGMDDLLSSSDMVGWTALVPIEAEEEKRSVARHPGGGQTNYNTEAAGNPGRMGEYIASLPVESRLVTPWEEA